MNTPSKILFNKFLYLPFCLVLILTYSSGISGATQVVFENVENYRLYDKVLHQVITVRVTNELGRPVPFAEVTFFSSDTEIADFIFPSTFTDTSGLAASVIQCKLSEDIIENPPSEIRDRKIYIRATVGEVSTEDVLVDMDWGFVDPWFMGPYFRAGCESFIDTSVQQYSSLTLHGRFVEIMGPIELDDCNFNAFSTNSQIACVETAIFDSSKAMVSFYGVNEGTSNIIVDGIPPAVISVRVNNNTKIKNQIFQLPQLPTLNQNYPNPFNFSTEIRYTLPNSKANYQVQLNIYDVLGRLVKVLVDQEQAAGSYAISWDGADQNGNSVSSGVYFYTLETNTFRSIRKILIIQ